MDTKLRNTSNKDMASTMNDERRDKGWKAAADLKPQVPDWHKEILDRRLAAADDPGIPWKEVRQRLE